MGRGMGGSGFSDGCPRDSWQGLRVHRVPGEGPDSAQGEGGGGDDAESVLILMRGGVVQNLSLVHFAVALNIDGTKYTVRSLLHVGPAGLIRADVAHGGGARWS